MLFGLILIVVVILAIAGFSYRQVRKEEKKPLS